MRDPVHLWMATGRKPHILSLRFPILRDVCKINGFFTSLPHPPCLFYKRIWHSDHDKMVTLRQYSDISVSCQIKSCSLPPHLSPGFIDLLCSKQSKLGLGDNGVSCSVESDSLWPHGLWPSRLLCLWDSPGKNTGVGCHFFSRDLPNPGIKPKSPALAGGFFTTEPPGMLGMFVITC